MTMPPFRALILSLLAPLALAAPLAIGPASVGQAYAQTQSRAPINYRIDASASNLAARVAFFGLSSKTARFPQMEGTVSVVSGQPERATIDVTIDARTIEAPDETTLQRLRGDKFFWVDRHPAIRFVGRSITLTSPTRGKVTGELTARGVTRTETLDVTFASDPTRATGQPVTLTGTMAIDRRNYGMTSYQLIVGNTVNIRLSARMVPR